MLPQIHALFHEDVQEDPKTKTDEITLRKFDTYPTGSADTTDVVVFNGRHIEVDLKIRTHIIYIYI